MSEKQLSILAVGAHPVDMEVACGAMLLKATKMGHKATLLHLTRGEKGNPKMSAAEYAKQKERETYECAELLGCDVRWLDYKDAEVPVDQKIQLEICDVIREVKPDIVITSWKGSFHRDHVAAHINTVRGVSYAGLAPLERPLPAHRVSKVYFTENWEDLEDYVAEFYVDVTDVFDEWVEAVCKHELVRGGISTFPYLEYYKSLAVVRGAEGGCRYAETFMQTDLQRRKKVDMLPL